MPTPPYVPDLCAHVRIMGDLGAGDEFGVGFWTPCESADVDHLSTFAEDVANAWAATILGDQSAAARLTSVRVLSYISGNEYAGEFTTTAGGGTAGDSLPAQVCAVVDWLESTTYRGGHPRTYVWGVPSSAFFLATSTLADAYRSALRSEAAAFLAAFNAIVVTGFGTPSLSTLHRVAAGAPLHPGYLSTLHSPSVRGKVGSQRRRAYATS